MRFYHEIVAAPPFAPSRPRMVDTSTSSITVSWDPPSHLGGSPISLYEIQTKQSDRSEEWETLSSEVQDTMFVAFDLMFKQYEFRVRGCNEFGWGEFSEASDSIRLTRRF